MKTSYLLLKYGKRVHVQDWAQFWVDLANGTLWLRWRVKRGEQHPFLEDLNLSPISYQNDPSRLREFLVKLT